METSLHRALKAHYAGDDRPRTEVRLGGYRIDAIRRRTLVEIQHGSLAAIRTKISKLLVDGHRVLVVKPIVARKTIIIKAARTTIAPTATVVRPERLGTPAAGTSG